MKRSSFPLLAAVALFCAPGAHAIIVYNGDNAADNTNAPTDDPGWANVGSADGAVGSVVYLGEYDGSYWAISADHVITGEGVTSVTFGTTSYAIIAGSVIVITDSSGNPVDLNLFQIAANPDLPTLTLASTEPMVGTAVTYIGYGQARADSRSYWSVSGSPPTWTALPNSTGANYKGYAVNGAYTKTWGANTITAVDQTISIGYGSTQTFYSTFSASTGSSVFYAGDSGGATFEKVGGVWELVGINDALGTLDNQPAGTVVVGDTSYSVDLSAYYSQINGYLTAVPEPATYGAVTGGILLAVAAVMRRRRVTTRVAG